MLITLKDNSKVEFENNLTAYQIASKISLSLAKKMVAAIKNDELIDMNEKINEDAKLEFILNDDARAFNILNHSCAHLLAHAIKRLYPNALFGIGPTIEEGFYYDIDFGDISITDKDLPKIEEMMQKIKKEEIEIIRKNVKKDEALNLFKENPYKLELINELEGDISIYTQNDFTDLCRGVHIGNTKNIKAFKLLSLAGAYWRGNSNNKQLTRIYGVAFFKEDDLKNHLNILEERKKRDHRKLGKELDLFMISEYGPGFPFWLPKGMALRKELEAYWMEIHQKNEYKLIQTPIMLDKTLWEISGHWFNYRENMYTSTIDDHEFAIKPMNCPGSILVYKNQIHSYRELPLRIGELGLVHRHEASGALNGLFRVRTFTQDDAHIFMRKDQIVEEVAKLVKLYEEVYSKFNLQFNIELSTRPLDKYIGSIEIWDEAEKALASALESINKPYKINEGDGAFYGPKLDFKLKDSMNRIWQCGTIQLDMNLPERFDITYIDDKGEKERPVMLHRALFGSLERFIGILIEHFGGAFPTWLSPVQVKLIPVNNQYHEEYANSIYDELLNNKIRVEKDYRDEKLGYKIREAQTLKIPYQLVIGDNEVNNNLVTYRKYGKKEQFTVTRKEFLEMINKEIKERKDF